MPKRGAWALSAALISFLLNASSAHAAPSAWLRDQTSNRQELRGRFLQPDYGFSVSPPYRSQEYVTDGGDGDHGVRMILGDHRKIDIDAEYTDPDWGNTRPCGSNQFPWEMTSKRKQGSARLGTQVACLVVFTDDENARCVIQAAASDRGQGIIYTMLLTTTVQKLQEDLISLRQVAASFKRTRITP